MKRSLLLIALCVLPACTPRSCEDPHDFIQETPIYKIKIHYPKTSVRAMTCELRQDIDAELESFKHDLPPSPLDANFKCEFNAAAFLRDPRPGLESAELNIFYISGNVHPISKVVTLNYAFDKQGWYKLDLGRLFKSGVDWRGILLPYARAAALKLNKDMAWVDKGLEDRDGQWSRFSMDPGALTLIFEPYQVAPYVAGRVRVPIAWAALQGKLNPRWFPAQGVK